MGTVVENFEIAFLVVNLTALGIQIENLNIC
jgi:hypothetical protein